MTGDVTLGALRRFPKVTFQSMEIASNNTANSANPFAGYLRSRSDALTAHAGGGQTNALQIVSELNTIATVANPADSVKLPASLAGMVIIINNNASNSIQVFGAGIDTIDSVATATGIPQAGFSQAIYSCSVAGNWVSNINPGSTLLDTQYTAAAASGTFGSGQLTGANFTVFNATTSTPGTITTRTAVQMFADTPNAFPGQVYILHLIQSGTGTLTIAAGSGAAISGTATISTSTWREFAVTLSSATAVTFQNIGGGSL